MKKTSLLLLIIVVMASFGLTTSAKGGLKLEVSKTLSKQNKTIHLVINASENPGFCYLKLNVEYDSSIIELTEVKNGIITNGSFVSNSQSLLWDSANDSKALGQLAELEFHIIKETKDNKYEITVNAVECYNTNEEEISIIGLEKKDKKENDSSQTTLTTNEDDQPKKNNNSNNEKLLEAIDLALKDNGYQTITNVKNDDSAFVEVVNKKAASMQISEEFKTVDDIVNTYQEILTENYIEIINEKTDKKQVESVLQSALKKAGADTIAELTTEQKKVFVKESEKGMSEISDDIPALSEKIDTQKVVEAIQKVAEQSGNDQLITNKYKYIWLFVGTGSTIVVGVIVIFAVKRTKKQKETVVFSQKDQDENK